jgi:hypothetical protein
MAAEDELRDEAVERIKERRGFLVHLAIYAVVNVAMFALWAIAGGGFWMGLWLTVGWGIGLGFHGLSVLIENQEMSTERADMAVPISPETYDDSFIVKRPDRLAERRGFLIHLGVYLAVNAALMGVWFMTGGGVSAWPLWATLGWGIGVAIHGLIMAMGHRQPDETRVHTEIDRLESRTQGPAPTA